jgi:type I restriction enzyme S subunit
MFDLKPYPEYKKSGVQWLGKVPKDWKVRRSKYVFHERDDRSISGTETHLSMSQKYGLIPSSKIEERRLVSESYYGAKLCEPNDLILNRLKAHLGIFALACERGLVSPDYTVLRPEKTIEPRYYEALYRTPLYRVELCKRIKGIVQGFWRLYTDDFYDIRVPVPPAKEQTAIVRFLGYINNRIRRFIRAKQRIIKLLEEQKQAIIHRAVTRGLEPSVPLKNSGVSWLGEIPAHWEKKRLKYIAILKSGESITFNSIKDEGEFPVYGGNGLRGYTNFYTHEGNYALIGRQGALCGNINYAKDKFWASEHAVVVSIIGNDNFIWLGELLRTMNLNQYSQSAAQPGLSVERIQNLSIPVPSLNEQSGIVAYILSETSELNNTIYRIKSQIALLREYRTRLIADVVTGKLDVRAAAENLPDEVDEPEEEGGTSEIGENGEDVESELDDEYEEVEV